MSRSRDRRHGSSERGSSENEKSSPLGEGWPLLTDLYYRTSEDLTEPPLVKGRLPIRDPGCPLCTLAEDLVEDKGYEPERAAWAERELVVAIHRDRGPGLILEELEGSYGVEVPEEDFERHVAEHLPSGELQDLASMRGWSPEEFNAHSWRSLFDTLHLVVEKTRQGVASGDLTPTLAEGISAARAFADLLAASFETKQSSTSDASLAQMQMFVGLLSQVIEDTVEDEHLRDDLFDKMQKTLADHTGPAEVDPASQFPRGREDSSREAGTGQAGEPL